MKVKALYAILFLMCWCVAFAGEVAWAIDEAVLTPTHDKKVAVEEKEFDEAMAVWMKHRYNDGERMLREFSRKHPDSRWAAEADLHVGCSLAFRRHFNEARSIFERLMEKHRDSNIKAKAKIRLANVAKQTGKWDEAMKHYTEVLQMNPTWDQFKYANYHARKLILSKPRLQAMINCGPIALAACLETLGKSNEAAKAKLIIPGEEGMTLSELIKQAEALGVHVKPVEMSTDDLNNANLPVLAHVQPNHFLAVLSVNKGVAKIEDSIEGKYEISLEALKPLWSGKALVFNPDTKLKPISVAVAAETKGGCCGQADEDECIGSCEVDCNQMMSPASSNSIPGSQGKGGGCGNCGGASSNGLVYIPASPGSPTWSVNTVNLNILLEDTPIWYNPGKGPMIAFTLTYSNENSNTGIFGRGWRCPYDMKVFFLPSDYELYPTLQVHLHNGRIETYQWNGTEYGPRDGMERFGYRDKIEKLQDGTVVLKMQSGGKYYFMPEGDPAEGRIHILEDIIGNRVICEYESGNLARVVDANNRVTTILANGSGITERIEKVTIPDGRYAEFGYTSGNLTSIADMGLATTTLTYDAMSWVTGVASTQLAHAITADSPTNGGILHIEPTLIAPNQFPPSGTVQLATGEVISYTSRTERTLNGITRGNPSLPAPLGCSVNLQAGTSLVPYLSTVITPLKKTKFVYEWWRFLGQDMPVVALHEVYECGANEQYSIVPTIHYAWCSQMQSSPYGAYYTKITRYPTMVTSGASGCDSSSNHWTGGLTTTYYVNPDMTSAIINEVGNATLNNRVYEDGAWVRYTTDPNGNTTRYQYNDHQSLASLTNPLQEKWSYTYKPLIFKPEAETDPKNNLSKIYSYNAAGQVTKMETELKPGERSVIAEFIHDPVGGGRLVESYDGGGIAAGHKTTLHYNEDLETRGFVTSVHDPENHETKYHYDAKGRCETITDAKTNTIAFQYDDLDRITKATHPDSTFVEIHYSCCKQEWVKDENGRIVKYEYDKKNRPWATVANAIEVQLNQNLSSTDQPTVISLNTTLGFPSNGAILLKDQAGNAEIVTYTGVTANSITGVSRAAYGTSAQAFSLGDNATQGNMSVVVYDPVVLDWVTSAYDANEHRTNVEYYANSKVKKIVNPDGTWVQYTYDPAGNLARKEVGHANTATKTTCYRYDANNRLIESWTP